jgi:hypothetical protein
MVVMKTKITLSVAGLALMLTTAVVFAFGMECPIDGNTMMWTGKTRFEYGKMLKEYRCPAGHVSWVVE